MSPILPISFLVTLLCAFGAIEGVLFQQLMFVGAALSATILVCSLEAWSAREIPVRATTRAGFAISIRNTEPAQSALMLAPIDANEAVVRPPPRDKKPPLGAIADRRIVRRKTR